jgi:ankyrin repeat protein
MGFFGPPNLIKAVMEGKKSEVERHLDNGADINCRDKGRWIDLHLGSDLYQRSWQSGERTPLYWASEKGYTEIVKLLIERGADVNACDEFGETPLHRASYNGYLEIASILIKEKANIHAKCVKADVSGNIFKNTPLNYARGYVEGQSIKTRNHKEKIAKLLEKHGATDILAYNDIIKIIDDR